MSESREKRSAKDPKQLVVSIKTFGWAMGNPRGNLR